MGDKPEIRAIDSEPEIELIALDVDQFDDQTPIVLQEFEEFDVEAAICQLVARTGHMMIANVHDDGTILVTDVETGVTCELQAALAGEPTTVLPMHEPDLATKFVPVLIVAMLAMLLAAVAGVAYFFLV